MKTITFDTPPVLVGFGAVVGQKEGKGYLREYVDEIVDDALCGRDSFEQAESELQQRAVAHALNRAGLKPADIDATFAGDLLAQCIGSTFALENLDIPLVGLYGACSTMAEALGCAAAFLQTQEVSRALAVTSSHFCASERQFRFPLEYASLRTPTAQWTATAAGAAILAKEGTGARVKRYTVGRIVDPGVTDQNNMGAAMAPAAADTLLRFFADTDSAPADFDAVFTGDLGAVGSELMHQLLEQEGIALRDRHRDCGRMLFDDGEKDVHAGGSGCGCSAATLCSFILKEMENGRYKRVLFAATGALLSPTSTLQGASIPGIAHLIELERS